LKPLEKKEKKEERKKFKKRKKMKKERYLKNLFSGQRRDPWPEFSLDLL
jgi:hypothetical protein